MPKFLFVIILFLSNCISFSSEPQILWWFDINDSAFGQSAIEDIDDDGKYEIVFGCYRNDSMVYAINAENGSLLWKYNTSGYQEGCNDAAPIIFDVNNDGSQGVIVASSCNPYTYCFDGKSGELIWRANTRGSDSPPTIADFNNDGNYDILHGEFSGYVISIDAQSGFINWEILVDSNSWVQTAPMIVDVNSDGQFDFVVATWNFYGNSKLYAYNGIYQSLLWSFPLSDYAYHGTAVADLNNDSKPELIIGDYSGALWVISAESGELIWHYAAGGYIGSPVSIADVNLDNHFELFFCSGYEIISLSNEGEEIWKYQIPNYQTAFRGVALSDINNDEMLDVVFGTSGGKLIALDGISGEEIIIYDLAAHIGKSFDINHAPVIGDFDDNGILDAFIVGGNTSYPDYQNNYGRAYAVELGKGFGPDWKMFQQNIWRTGTILHDNSSVSNHNDDEEKTATLFFPYGSTILLPEEYLYIDNICIYDVCGRMIYSDINRNNLNIANNLSRGLYFIKSQNRSNITYQNLLIY